MNKTATLASLALAASLAITPAAQATDVSYDFLELRFVETEIDTNGGDLDGDGFLIGGSYNFNENWYVIGSFSQQDFDRDVDLDALELGAGYVFPIDPNFDLFASLSYLDYSVDLPPGFADADEDGFRIQGGIRSRFNEQFEGRAILNYADLDDSDTFIQLGGDFYFTDEFAAGITIDLGGDVDTITFGGRWFFGGRRIK